MHESTVLKYFTGSQSAILINWSGRVQIKETFRQSNSNRIITKNVHEKNLPAIFTLISPTISVLPKSPSNSFDSTFLGHLTHQKL